MSPTTSIRRTFTFWLLCAVLMSFVPLAHQLTVVQAAELRGQGLHTQSPTLNRLLKADGSLDLSTGFTGSVDATGYTMQTDASGAPHFVPAAPQAAGDERWATGFSIPGIVQARITTMAVAANGDLYVGGNFTKIENLTVNNIARWDGESWHALGVGLTMVALGEVHQIITVGSDVYVVGEFNKAGTQTAGQIARWDGTSWSRIGNGVAPTFQGSNGVDGDAFLHAVAVVGSDLYVGGHFTTMGGVAANNIARWNGTAWSALGQGIGSLDFENNFDPDAEVFSLMPNGTQLYVGGGFSVAGTTNANSVAVWNGSSWSALGSGVRNDNVSDNVADVYALAMSGSLVYAGGAFTEAGGAPAANVAVWNGSAWSALGMGITGENFRTPVEDIVSDGSQVYVGGAFTDAGGETRKALAIWNAATSSWTDAGPALTNRFDDDSRVLTLALRADGELYVAGVFEQAGTMFVNNIATLRNSAWEPLGQGVGAFGNSMSGKVRTIAVDAGGRVYIGGEFEYAGAVKALNLAMWDGTRWHNIGDADKPVRALLMVGDDLYAAGLFSNIGGVAANYIARWNRLSGQWSGVGGGTNDAIYALAYSDGILYAGGSFTSAGGTTADDLAYWDGAQWSAFGATYHIFEVGDTGQEVGTHVYALAAQGDTVIIGGYFQTVHRLGTSTQNMSNYRLVNNVVGWKRTTDGWFYIGNLTPTEEPGVTTDNTSGFGTQVRALAISGSDVYIGGEFNKAGTQAAKSIVKWSTAQGQYTSLQGGTGGVDTGLDPNEVWGLALRGSELYVTGHFTTAGSVGARYVGRWNTVGNSWSALGSGLKWYNDNFTYAYALGLAPDAVYVGGVFDTAGVGASVGFAQWTPETVVGPTATGTIVLPAEATTTVPPTATTGSTTVPGATATPTATTGSTTGPGATATSVATTVPTTGSTTTPGQGFRVYLPMVRR